mgnify:CR=1 FL=1
MNIIFRPITPEDNPAIARVIRQVSAEFGLTADKGYTVADPNLDELYQLYSQPGHAYWVVEQDGRVVGGGGVATHIDALVVAGGGDRLGPLQRRL